MRNVAADCIRVTSLLYIVGIWHLQEYGKPLHSITKTAWGQYLTVTALSLFVLLSAAFLGQKNMSTKQDLKEFYKNRFYHIYVPFLISSFIFAITNTQNADVLLKGVFLYGIIVNDAPGTLWFVVMIIIFYLITPLLILIKQRTLTYFATAICTMLIMCAVGIELDCIDTRLLVYFPVFLYGIKFGFPQYKDTKALFIVSSVALIGILVSSGVRTNNIAFSPLVIPWAIGSSILVTSLISRLGRNWCDRPYLTVLVRSSYFMYLLHRPIYKILLTVTGLVGFWNVTLFLLLVALPFLFLVSIFLSSWYQSILNRTVLSRR